MAERDQPTQRGLAIGVLGPLTVHLNGRPLTLGGHRQSAVLVALVLAGGAAVSPDALVDAVWPGGPPAQPQPALQAHISHLRKRLEPDGAPGLRTGAIERVGSGYALRLPDTAVDAWLFERLIGAEPAGGGTDPVSALSAALALWRGPALADYADEEWAAPTAQRWTEMRSAARERLYDARLRRGESGALIPELETFTAEAPLREERWRLLALALYRAHRQADALAALRRVRTLLSDELGVDPGPALRSLETEILAQSASLDAPRPQPERAVAVTATRPPAGRDGDGGDIVERGGELSDIDAAVGSALGGAGRVVLIEGPAGIGKTRLLREVRTRAGSARVLSARGSQLEREYGFGVVRQLFEPAVAGGDRDVLFTGAAGTARSVFHSHPDSDWTSGDTTFGVLHGLYWLTVALAAHSPLVVTVDDVQWCDVGSLRFLGFLAHRLEELPVVLVVTLRTGEQHDNDDLLAELLSEASTLVVTPRPLSSAGVDELVSARLGEHPNDAFVAACRRTTGGNPLLLRQLLRALEADGIKPTASNADTVRAIGSRAVSGLVLRRFARMPADSRAAARAVAILGDGASVPLVAALSGLPPGGVAEAIGALARAEVLRHDHPLDFVHPLVRDAVYGDIPLGTREIQHEQAAKLLAGGGATAEQIAAQLLKSPPRGDPETVQILLAAAARSLARGAPDGSVTYLTRALQEPPSPGLEPQVYLELGQVETMTDVPSAVTHLTAAYQRLADIGQRARAAVMLGRVELFAGTRGHSREIADLIGEQLTAEYDDERQWLQAISRMTSHMHALGRPSLSPPEILGTGPGARSLAAAAAWELVLDGADRQRAIELATFALAGEVLDDADQAFMGAVARNVLEVAEAAPTCQWDDALAKAYVKGSLFAVLGAQVWGGYAHWIRGNLDEALQWLRNCTEQNALWGAQQIGQTYTDAFMINVLVDRGDLAGAQALADADPAYRRVISEGQVLVMTARARVLHRRGLHQQALAELDLVGELSAGIENPVWRPWRSDRAVVLGAMGRRDEALELAAADLELARRWGTARGNGRHLRILGTLRGSAGIEELREAVAMLGTSQARLELAIAQATLADQLAPAEAGSAPVEAVQAWRAAHALAADCGAAALRVRTEESLRTHGEQVPALPDRTALTTTERRIVEMSVDGAFEQEIAQALFITTGTVRHTLESVRTRLGGGSAEQLRAVAAAR